jgi:hypothetical protein
MHVKHDRDAGRSRDDDTNQLPSERRSRRSVDMDEIDLAASAKSHQLDETARGLNCFVRGRPVPVRRHEDEVELIGEARAL